MRDYTPLVVHTQIVCAVGMSMLEGLLLPPCVSLLPLPPHVATCDWNTLPVSSRLHPVLQHMVAKHSGAAVAKAALWALIAAGADVNKTDCAGNTPCHWTAMFSSDVEAAAAAARVLISAGANPYALNDEGRQPAALVLHHHEDVAGCSALLETLLGQAAGSCSRHGSDEAARSGSGCAAAAMSAANNLEEGGELPSKPSAPPLLDLGPAHCPVCLEPGACLAGPCGHLVCKACAEIVQVN